MIIIIIGEVSILIWKNNYIQNFVSFDAKRLKLRGGGLKPELSKFWS